MSSNAPRVWTDPQRRELLDRLREGSPVALVARSMGRGEADCRAEAALLRERGWTASGATRRSQAPPPSRDCLSCSDPFAPETRFMFMCQVCRREAWKIAA